MKVGIIAEGWDDCGAIYNLIPKFVPIDSYDDIKFIRPKRDATDGDDAAFSNWSMVREECIEKTQLNKFLTLYPNDEKLVVVHLDTAECEDYGVRRPDKLNGDLVNYSTDLRNLIIIEISKWIGVVNYNISHAIAMEEIEAWIIALLDDSLRVDSSSINDPKRQLELRLNSYISDKSCKLYKSIKASKGAFAASNFLSGGFTRKKELLKAEERNHSLHLFCDELRNMFP